MSRLGQLATVSGLLFTAAASSQTIRFDSTWWRHSIHDEERTGFVLGYFDCPKAPKEAYGATSDDYVKYVYKYLGSSSKFDTVPPVLQQANFHIHPHPILSGGEEYPEKHGWLDGEWWGDETRGDVDDKTGYIEGYLACELGSANAPQTQRLVKELNLHFSSEKNQHDKIANVLEPMINRERRRN